jgi:uncharacterized protein YbaA (DUF1428 family)
VYFDGYVITYQIEVAMKPDIHPFYRTVVFHDTSANEFFKVGSTIKTEHEEVVFSWIEYPSKEVRDAANQKMMSDPRMKEFGESMPFDGKRMIYGGFAPIMEE